VNEFLRNRITRKLESLPDEKAYQVLDYLEFLESKYAGHPAPAASGFQRLAETVEDTLRAGRVSATAIQSTMDALAKAGRLMSGLAAAGKAVVNEVAGTRPPPEAPAAPSSAPPPAAAPPEPRDRA
jgi:hypothetical protein